MKINTPATYALTALLLLAGAASCVKETAPETMRPSSPQIEEECADGELLVKFAPEMSAILDGLGCGVQTRSGIPSMDEVLEILGPCTLRRIFPVDPRHEERSREAGLHLWYVVTLPQGCDIREASRKLASLGEVSKVQGNRLLKRSVPSRPVFISCEEAAASAFPATRADGGMFNDPDLFRHWSYVNDGSLNLPGHAPVEGADAGCARAWELCTGDPSIIVAVLDEGVMYSHPDLAANIWENRAETFGSDDDADGNGYAGDRYGYNFVHDTGVIKVNGINDIGHGTHVAGTIAAVNNNGIGCCGIAGGDGTPDSGVKIMCCQVFDNSYTCTVVNEARAMKYAADNGAVIVQCSWGYNSCLSNVLSGYTPGPATEDEWYSLYPLEKEAIDYFIHNAGSPNGVIDGGLAIFASGNEYSAMSAFPAAYSGCISVSAIAADFTPSSYSNYGSEVELCAPGGDMEYHCIPGTDDDMREDGVLMPQGGIWSTMVEAGKPGYGYYEGTSMACPHVAGVAALGLSYAAKMRRHFTAEQFRLLLSETATAIDDRFTGEKTYYYNHSSSGYSPTRMNLVTYRGKMGRLVNAGALLEAVAGSGSDMRIPNFYLAPGETRSLDLALFYLDPDARSYSVSGGDPSIADIAIDGSVLTVKGKEEGFTKATVSVSGAESSVITITVRSNSSSPSWL